MLLLFSDIYIVICGPSVKLKKSMCHLLALILLMQKLFLGVNILSLLAFNHIK